MYFVNVDKNTLETGWLGGLGLEHNWEAIKIDGNICHLPLASRLSLLQN